MPRDDTPSILSLRDYARFVAGEMYPGQEGVGDQRDAARHLLASGTLARKYSPEVAAVLGHLHEITNAPIDSLLASLGLAPDPADRRMDEHNNRVGAALAHCAGSQSGLEDVVNREAEMATTKATPMRAMLSKYAKGGIVHDVTKAKIIPEREGPNLLTREYPKLSGFLQGMLGMAPDEVGTGSVLDVDTSENRKLQQLGAKYGFPIGTLAGMVPFGGGVAKAPGVAAGSRTAQRGVIKAPGGNWLRESIPYSVKGLKKQPAVAQSLDLEPELEAAYKAVDPAKFASAQRTESVNRWIDSKLAKYIQNEMASPGDSIRLAADAWPSRKAKMLAEAQAKIDEQAARTARIARERGQPEHTLTEERQRMIPLEKAKALIEARDGLHYRPNDMTAIDPPTLALQDKRMNAGFPSEGFAASPDAKRWEVNSDAAIGSVHAGDYLSSSGAKDIIQNNPWLAKVPPETPTYSTGLEPRDLGFGHLIDELRNSLNPESGLPKELLWKYEDLAKKTVPDAVEQVSKINAYRAAQKAEADLLRANNAATALHKEYPEAGFKWVELKAPPATGKKVDVQQKLSDELGLDEDGIREVLEEMAYDEGLDPGTEAFEAFIRNNHPSKDVATMSMDESEKLLADALRYEGDTMQHCVGGYCPDVLSGRSRIFSLRDAKGKPHVTIETKPGRPAVGNPEKYVKFSELTPDQMSQFDEYSKAMGNDPNHFRKLEDTHLFNPESGTIVRVGEVQPPPSIHQIKSYSNKAPLAEHLPYVQDFVRSGKWSDVGDIENAGLRRTRDVLNDLERETLRGYGHDFGDYMTLEERQGLQKMWDEGRAKGREGFAQGGLVQHQYNPAAIDARAAQLLEELEF